MSPNTPICNPRHLWVCVLHCKQHIMCWNNRPLGNSFNLNGKTSVVVLEDMMPSLLVEYISPKVCGTELFRFFDLLFGDNSSGQISFDDILESEKYGVIRPFVTASALKI